MHRFCFKRGTRFRENQTFWEMHQLLATGKIQFLSDTGEVLNLTREEVLSRWLSQTWRVDEESLGELGKAVYIVTPRDLSTYPPKLQEIAKRRLYYIQAVAPESTPYNPTLWEKLIATAAEACSDTNPPSASSVAEWWRRYRQTKSILKLIPSNKPANSKRKGQQYRIFEEVIGAVYLTEQKLPKLVVAEKIHLAIHQINNGLPAEEKIKPPARSTIYRWLEDLQQDIVDTAREGAEAARMKYRAAIGTVDVKAVLRRIEIDHTSLDLHVIDLQTMLPLGRPWLTKAIDRHSRLIVGFYISFSPPSTHSVLQCLRRSILPKEEWLARYPDIKEIWPAYGIPHLIAVDNGPDLHSEGVELACLDIGITVLFCASKSPDQKGSIERYIRTMNMGLVHRLPGTVFSNPTERGDYAAEERAVIDMETLIHLVTKWIVEVYNVTPHRGAGGRPLDLWLDSAAKEIIEMPTDPQQLELIGGIPAERTLFHYGIELDGLHYNSEQLQMIRRRFGKNIKLSLKYYADDVAHIHVLDPEDKTYLRVPAKLPEYAQGLAREVHRLIREHARKKFGEHCFAPRLLEAKQEIENIVADALRSKKMGVRKAGAKTVLHDSEAVLKGEDPLAKVRRPIKQVKEIPPEELPDGLNDDLPNFGSEG
ncbi:putative transposase [Formivibrio citricus]|uniref:Putative transposase n=1 Tax=Formivibrio citricus TaxID=83765 RepID=A0A1I5CUP8_9NEIS|nr:Mu transposase C-terminal domain-containing protein [Formivibrio citricus]SFN90682.1 putative transposase [Formivibrio citricus]